MASMRKEADDSYRGKLDRMGLGIQTSTTGPKTTGHQRSMEDGTDGMASGEDAEGYESESQNERTLEAKAPKKLRLDRKPFKDGGAVKAGKGATVNVIIAPQGGGAQPPAPPMPPPGPPAGPPPMMKPPGGGMPPPGGGPEMPGMGGPPAMMRKDGGRVPMDHGAGGGLGRLDKIKEYGSRAKPAGKAGTL